MIHSLSPTRIRRVPTGLDVLDELEAHWSDLKGASLLPDPNELFFGCPFRIPEATARLDARRHGVHNLRLDLRRAD